MQKYYEEKEVPVQVMEKPKTIKKIKILSSLKQMMPSFGQLVFIIFIAVSQVVLFSAFEAHVINVTARICNYVETRTMGFWKTHPNVIEEAKLYPQFLGGCPDVWFYGFPAVFEVFKNADADIMVDMLKGQLLAMKFNVAYFPGTGDFEYEGETINQIIEDADAMLRMCPPPPPREDLEAMKNLLDLLNNMHQLIFCSEPNG